MEGAKKIQDDSADLKFALEATKKALAEIEARRRQKRKMRGRQKREEGDEEEDDEEEMAAEMEDKVEQMKEKERRLDGMYDRARAMVDRIKQLKNQIRGSVRKLNVGVQFEGLSSLELKNPDDLEELAVKTEVSMYFNVTDKKGDGRAFLMYMGNEVGGVAPRFLFPRNSATEPSKCSFCMHGFTPR